MKRLAICFGFILLLCANSSIAASLDGVWVRDTAYESEHARSVQSLVISMADNTLTFQGATVEEQIVMTFRVLEQKPGETIVEMWPDFNTQSVKTLSFTYDDHKLRIQFVNERPRPLYFMRSR